MSDKIIKSEAEWRSQLTAEQYHVAREHGTERAFTGALDKHYEKAPIAVYAVVRTCFRQRPSSIRAVAGPAFMKSWMPMP